MPILAYAVLSVSQFMQALFTDAEVMGHLMDHGDPHLLDHFIPRPAPAPDREPEDGDAVG